MDNTVKLFKIWSERACPLIGDSNLSEAENTLISQLQLAPKIELHLHLEGAIPCTDIFEIARNRGLSDVAEVREKLRFRGYSDFFRAWFSTIDFLREASDFTFVVERFVERLERSGVVWAEVFVSPPDFEMRKKGPIAFSEVLKLWLDAFDRVKQSNVEVRLIVDLVRLYPPSNAARWLEEVIDLRSGDGGERIVGIGFGGPENSTPLKFYKSVVRRARDEGLLCVAHAGECGSARDVEDAVFDLRIDRLGHALGLVSSDRAYSQVMQNRLPIEICPSSSIHTGMIEKISAHPIKHWFEDGCAVVIGTDDPSLFKTEMSMEYLHLHRAFGWGNKEFQRLLANSIEASLMPRSKANAFKEQINRLLPS